MCLAWAASHGSFSKRTETELHSFLLHAANENAALALPIKWIAGTRGTSQLATGVGFHKAMASVPSGERSTGYSTFALSVLGLFPSYRMLYKVSITPA